MVEPKVPTNNFSWLIPGESFTPYPHYTDIEAMMNAVDSDVNSIIPQDRTVAVKVTSSETGNGTALVQAYEKAKTLSPAANKQVTVLVPRGVYDLSGVTIQINTPFINIVCTTLAKRSNWATVPIWADVQQAGAILKSSAPAYNITTTDVVLTGLHSEIYGGLADAAPSATINPSAAPTPKGPMLIGCSFGDLGVSSAVICSPQLYECHSKGYILGEGVENQGGIVSKCSAAGGKSLVVAGLNYPMIVEDSNFYYFADGDTTARLGKVTFKNCKIWGDIPWSMLGNDSVDTVFDGCYIEAASFLNATLACSSAIKNSTLKLQSALRLGSSAILSNCKVQNALDLALYVYDDVKVITNCQIDSNSTYAISAGGAVGPLSITGCDLNSNGANAIDPQVSYGGGNVHNKVWVDTAAGSIDDAQSILVGWYSGVEMYMSFEFDNTTRALTLRRAGAVWNWLQLGVSYSAGAEDPLNPGEYIDEITAPNTEGLKIIYYLNDTLVSMDNPSFGFLSALMRSNAMVCYLWWNVDTQKLLYLGPEMHKFALGGYDHTLWHFNIGATWQGGLTLGNFAFAGGADDASAQFSIELGYLSDEDIFNILGPVSQTVGLGVKYLEGSTWRKDLKNGFSVKRFGASRLAFNEFTGGVYQQTEVTNNYYVWCHIFASNEHWDFDNELFLPAGLGLVSIQAQAQYSSNSSAQDGVDAEITNLRTLIPEQESMAVASILFKTSNTYSNGVLAIVEELEPGVYYRNWLTKPLSPGGTTPGSHLALSDLLGGIDNDAGHTAMAVATGRAGGQTIEGGTLTTEDGTLKPNAIDAKSVKFSEIEQHVHSHIDVVDFATFKAAIDDGRYTLIRNVNEIFVPAGSNTVTVANNITLTITGERIVENQSASAELTWANDGTSHLEILTKPIRGIEFPA